MQSHLLVRARSGERRSPPHHARARDALAVALGLGALGGAASAAAQVPPEAAERGDAAPLPAAQDAPPEVRAERGPRQTRAPEAATLGALGSLVEVRDDYLSRGRRGFFNATVLRGDYAWNKSVSVRVDVPLALAGGAAGQQDFGLGDVLIRPLVRAVGTPRFALLVGADLVLDSAARPALGAGRNQIAPLVQAQFGASRGTRLGLVVQHVASFGGDPGRAEISATVIRPFAVVELPRGFWLQPDQKLHINHTGAPRLVATSVLELGKALSDRVLVYVDPGLQIAGGPIDWLVTAGVRWALPAREATERARASAPAQSGAQAIAERDEGRPR